MISLFLPSVALHIETINFICLAIQLTGFYMKCKIKLTSSYEIILEMGSTLSNQTSASLNLSKAFNETGQGVTLKHSITS